MVAWVEQDVPSTIEDLRGQDNCAALVLHDDAPDRQNLEAALARSASMPALTKALDALAASRSYSWEKQRDYLVSTAEGITQEEREAMKRAASLGELFAALDEGEARTLITQALAAKSVAPFEMKGARQGRSSPKPSSSWMASPSRFVACSASWSPGSKAAVQWAKRFSMGP